MIDLRVEDSPGIKHTSRVIYTVLNDGSKAYIKYNVVDKTMVIEETYVPPQHRGKGLASELMEYAINLAMRNSWLIKPYCSFAIGYFLRNREKRSLLVPEMRNVSDDELREMMIKRREEELSKNSAGKDQD